MDVQTNSGGPPYAPKYVMLNEYGDPNAVHPPPYRRNIPRYHSTPHTHKKGNCCLKCICCFYCFLFFFIFAVSAFGYYVYALYQPKLPTYKIQHIGIGAFDVQVDFSLYTEITVTIVAENPNEGISIFYADENEVVVDYMGMTLCSGSIPAFYQGKKNITNIHLVLKGKSEFGTNLQKSLMDNQKSGQIPLTVRVKVPFVVEIIDIPLKKVTGLVNCSIVIDSLTPKKKVSILSTKYRATVDLS